MNNKKAMSKTHPVARICDPKQRQRLEYVATHHPERLALFERIYSGKASPRQCVKAFCLECNKWSETAIDNCGIFKCPLWRQRPFQTGKAMPVDVGAPLLPEPLPPIVTEEELMAQLEQMEANGHPGHFLPSEDGID
jgi:hypothetical protein